LPLFSTVPGCRNARKFIPPSLASGGERMALTSAMASFLSALVPPVARMVTVSF